MTAAVQRELRFKYGSYEVGGTTDRMPTGKYTIVKAFDRAEAEFTFVVSRDTKEGFVAECAAAEAAFRKPYQDFVITLKGSPLLKLRPSENSGLNTQPHIEKVGGEEDSGNSRKYRVRVECSMPADNAPEEGLRESTVAVDADPADIRKVRISGLYTAVGGNNALEQYQDRADAFCTAVLNSLTGTFEEDPAEERFDYDTNTKHLNFERVYDELNFGQGADSPLDDPAIRRQTLLITRHAEGPGDHPLSDAKRLVRLQVSYEAWFQKDTDLQEKWEDIHSWVLSHVSSVLEGAIIARVEEAPEFDFDHNRIRVSMMCLGRDGGDVLKTTVTVSDALSSGRKRVAVWSEDGDPFTYYVYQGPAQLFRTIRQSVELYGLHDVGQAGEKGAKFEAWGRRGRPYITPLESSGAGWDFESRNVDDTQERRGLGDDTIDVTVIEITTVYAYVRRPGGQAHTEESTRSDPRTGRQVAITP